MSELTQTDKIRNSINRRIRAGEAFTAAEICAGLLRRNPDANALSIITGVTKLMKREYSQITAQDIPGRGPRLQKIYNQPLPKRRAGKR